MDRKMIDFTKLSDAQLKEFKNKYDAYIFDMDGTLTEYYGGRPIEGVEKALNEIAGNGKSIMVLTDNCGSLLKDIVENLNRLFPVIKKENIMNTGHLVVRYLKERNFKKKIYVIGSKTGLIRELMDSGFDVLYDADELKQLTISDLMETKFEEDVGAVVIGFDLQFNYLKLFKATNYLVDPEVQLIQTFLPNSSSTNPILIGVGSIISSVKAASGRSESIATGKGSAYGSEYLKSIGVPVERCLFIGDGINHDVVAGNIIGMDTMLLLSGVSSLEDVDTARAQNAHEQIPTYYANSVADLIKVFKA